MRHHGAGEGHGGQVASQLLAQHRHLHQAQPETSLVVRALDRRPSLLGHGRPQVVVEMALGRRPPPGRGSIGHAPSRRLGAGVAQRDLVVGELEIHRPEPTDGPVGSLTRVSCWRGAMDLTTTPEQERLRGELREWLRSTCHGSTGWVCPRASTTWARRSPSVGAGRRTWPRAGWVAVTWPAAYGGRGLGPAENFVVQEELARARAPELVGRIGVNLAGPTLLAHGTDDQKARWLPAIPPRAELWCQLFSEPDAGSDLAAVRTTAPRSTGAGCSTGRRSGPPTPSSPTGACAWPAATPRPPSTRACRSSSSTCTPPGVEVRPLVQLTGEAEFNEVVLHDVFVPDDQLVGAPGEGWRVAGSTLSHERGVNPRQLVIHMQHLEELLRLRPPPAPSTTRGLRRKLAQAYVEVRLFQLHNWRSLSKLQRGLEPGPEGSILKLYWSEMSKRLHELALEVLGPAAPLWRDATDNPGRRIVAAGLALLSGGVDLRRDQRDPAQRDRRTCARPAA